VGERIVCPRCGTTLDEWKQPKVTVDVLVEDAAGRVLLIKRKNPPEGWAIPGGFVDVGETLEAAAVRELKEETGLDVELLGQFHTYSDPRRDPRHHTVTTVFRGRPRDPAAPPEAGDDALEAAFFDPTRPPAPMAFDHADVLRDLLARRRAPTPP
jgi:8-oxo-dGTP diphosphatase